MAGQYERGRQLKPAIWLFVLASCVCASGQSQRRVDFVIDASKPYVFLKFDHIGSRRPIREGESSTGVWLRVVNNCHVPIVFEGRDGTPGEPGVVLLDEVVDKEPMLEIFASPTPDIQVESEPPTEPSGPIGNAVSKPNKKPNGYTSELPGTYRVAPGKELLFSFPRNHVSSGWYMRVKFALDLNSSSASIGPFTYLPFHENDLPKEFRSARLSSTERMLPATGNMLHEAGHARPSQQQ